MDENTSKGPDSTFFHTLAIPFFRSTNETNIIKNYIMTKWIPTILMLAIIAGCNSGINSEQIQEKTSLSEKVADTIPRVTGVGGIFFLSENPQSTKEWYGNNLGMAIDAHGSVFEFRNAYRPEEINYLRWGPFDDETDYFDPSEKQFMINFRVQNIEGLVKKLKANGVTVLDEIASYDYGKFVHILDPEGNKIELWEPVDSVLTKLGGETTK
jgi:predicted enzyme related to lactoylglutathione lyase